MFTELFRVEGPWPGKLWISPRPRGGDWLEEELRAWRHAGIDIVLSLLETAEAADLGLEDEKDCSEAAGIEFLALPIADRSVPDDRAKVERFLKKLESKLNLGQNAVIHCRQGIGRAGLVAALLLIEQGIGPALAIQRVSSARGVPVPETDEQKVWIESFAAQLARED